MRMLPIAIAAVVGLSAPAAYAAQPPIEAAEAFEQRQRDLITLSRHLGSLHRLKQVCGDPYNANQYRNRMKSLIPLEAPMSRTRLDMIAAFNEGFREMAALHAACSEESETLYQKMAERALAVTDRLYAPFR